ncbi:hypothetical protein RISK_004651 [Rhodopirellula islandica]|uniref:Transmembrane protein n=1 Tax=Rhodopirellula islandica TaxID=595434 RepID=A0A0J1ECS3_RHOIS|nr:hypothetical protein RISK_004651 [Rhodopirellula islandica]
MLNVFGSVFINQYFIGLLSVLFGGGCSVESICAGAAIFHRIVSEPCR